MAIIRLSPSKTYTDNSVIIINYNIPNTTEWQTRLQESPYDTLYVNVGASTLTLASKAITKLPAEGSFTADAVALNQENIIAGVFADDNMNAESYGETISISYDTIETELAQFVYTWPYIYINNQLTAGVFYQYINNTWQKVLSHVYLAPAVDQNVLGRATLGSLVLQ